MTLPISLVVAQACIVCKRKVLKLILKVVFTVIFKAQNELIFPLRKSRRNNHKVMYSKKYFITFTKFWT